MTQDTGNGQTCLTCRLNRGELFAPGGAMYQDALWQLQHDIEPIALVGWLILKPLRHVEAFADLTKEPLKINFPFWPSRPGV